MRTVKLLLFLVALSFGAFADVASFDFESTAPGFHAGSLIVTNNGLTLTITPEGDPTGFVFVGNDGVPLLGTQGVIGSSVDPLASNAFDPLRFSFSQAVTAITFNFGDFGGDSDSPVVISGYDSGNHLLGTLTDTYPAGFTAGKSLSGTFAGASYFILTSGPHTAGSNSDSIFWEAPSVTFSSAVPEPSPVLALGGVLIALGALARRRRVV